MPENGQAGAGTPGIALRVLGVLAAAGQPTGQEQQSDGGQQPPAGQHDQSDAPPTGDQGNDPADQRDHPDDGVQPQQAGGVPVPAGAVTGAVDNGPTEPDVRQQDNNRSERGQEPSDVRPFHPPILPPPHRRPNPPACRSIPATPTLRSPARVRGVKMTGGFSK